MPRCNALQAGTDLPPPRGVNGTPLAGASAEAAAGQAADAPGQGLPDPAQTAKEPQPGERMHTLKFPFRNRAGWRALSGHPEEKTAMPAYTRNGMTAPDER
ncbi:hypothetical protein [Tahibacter harae]|uniref:Uncharacterized protein n=1 Tax=Tahibacter harae TaxID=2963937 RepID=A0ABT1QRH8_9GAMM|nr:hypothetical protein [Tahibacter harae]MCQ4164908.1 hypothetical protein [Tahibacter harae]